MLFSLFAMTSWIVLPAHAIEDAKAYYNRGTNSYEKGDDEAAIKDLSAALVLEPKSPDAYFNRGLSYRRQHRIEEAISDFSKAIELYSEQPRYYFERCNARIVKNDFEGAIADCSKTIRLSPAEAEPYLLRGVAFLLNDNLDQALEDSLRALHIAPDYRDAQRLLLETLHKKEIAYQKMISTTPLKPVVVEPKGIGMLGDTSTSS